MVARYVEVPAEKIRGVLLQAGFTLLPGYGEEVYERRHNRAPAYAVKVYSSIRRGAEEARACGQDAIRVAVVRYKSEKDRAIGLWKSARVYRTGSVEAVLERMIERAREGYAFINQDIKNWEARKKEEAT